MKKIYALMLAAACAIFLAGCTREILVSDEAIVPGEEMIICGTMGDLVEDGSQAPADTPDTRTQVRNTKEVWWIYTDRIAVFMSTSTTASEFTSTLTSGMSKTSYFSGTLKKTGSKYYVGYPSGGAEYSTSSDGTLSLRVPSSQTAVSGSFSSNTLPSYGSFTSSSTDFTMKPVAGGLKFHVSRDDIKSVKFEGNKELIDIIGGEMDWDYLQAVKEAMVDQDVILRQKDLNIVYSPMHGTGRVIIPMALRSWGFQNIHVVPEQMVIDGNFPTVVSPNPENAEAMTLGMKLGTRLNADLVIASDPDADRLAIVCRNAKGEWEILNGNQTCMMFCWYIIANKKKLGQLKGNEFLVKTIVTTEEIAEIAKKNGVELRDCYTGFKWIANEIRISEGKQKYIGGGEESFGFLPFDKVRDKDSPASICLICEIAAWAKDNGMTLYDLLMNIYAEYGFSKESTINVVKPGKTGADEIKQMMVDFRANPPKELGGEPIVLWKDYQTLEGKKADGSVEKLNMPTTANVLQWFCADGTKISVRPSGTEPKIKFYCEIKDAAFKGAADYEASLKKAEARIEAIKKSLSL